MLKTVRRLIRVLPRRQRWTLAAILLAVLLAAGLELVNVAMLVPFLVVAADPGIIARSRHLAWLHAALGGPSNHVFLLMLGGAALGMLTLSNLAIIGVVAARSRFTASLGYELSSRLLRNYMQRPYAFFLNRNAAGLGMNVLTETNQLTMNFIDPGLDGLAWSTVAIVLIAVVLVADPVLALSIAVVLGGFYITLYLLIRRQLARIDRNRVTATRRRFKIVSEAFGGIKEAKVLGREDAFIAQFNEPSLVLLRDYVVRMTLQKMPRYILEILAFGGIIVVALVIIARETEVGSMIPVLGLYAVVGYRLMPALQNAFTGLTRARTNVHAVTKLLEDYEEIKDEENSTPLAKASEPLPLREYVALEDIRFTYPEASAPVLDGLSIRIPAGAAVGIVGPTGAGKTTVIDLILGLLSPDSGQLVVDGAAVHASNIRAWQGSIGYVPQHIFLSDTSVTSNIAFGVPAEEVDFEAVRVAAKIAQIDDFIMQELPNRYDTLVGERGIRLSGGQRQRIGIARALYRDPPLLVLDEATSALDSATESALMDAVYEQADSQGRRRTLIMIAHRLGTLDRCDFIVELRAGRATLRRASHAEIPAESPISVRA